MSKRERVKSLLESLFTEIDTVKTGVKIKPKDAMNMDVNKLSQLAQKTNVVIGEDEATTVETTPAQENGVYKLQEWAALNKINLSSPENINGLTTLTFQSDKNKTIECFVYPDGTIKISGKVIISYPDFEAIVNFHNKY